MAISKETWAQISKQPLTQPPPGIVPDFEHPTWHGQPVVIASAIGLPAMLVMASIRIYSRCYLRRKWVFDDTVFAISLAAGISLIALQIALMTGGAYGYHAWEVTIGDLTKPVLMRSLTIQLAAPFLIWVIKLAVYSLIFYAFRPLTYIRWLVYIGISVSFCFYLAAAIVNGVICGPKGGTDHMAYLAGMAGQECGNPAGVIQILSIASGAVNLLNDLYLLILPLPAILKLKLARRQKVGVMFIFLAGAGACVMSILGLVYRRRGYSRDASSMWSRDTTYIQIPLLVVTTIEYSVGVMIPCMAPFAKLSKHFFVSVKSYVSTRSFHRTSSLEGDNQLDDKGDKSASKCNAESHTNTIDRMLARMFPGDEESQMSKTKDSREG